MSKRAPRCTCDVTEDPTCPVHSAAPVRPPIDGPICLTPEQEQAADVWAADDRLWTTQETVAFNLRVFARAILAAAAPPDGAESK